jgi:hypothetical protein
LPWWRSQSHNKHPAEKKKKKALFQPFDFIHPPFKRPSLQSKGQNQPGHLRTELPIHHFFRSPFTISFSDHNHNSVRMSNNAQLLSSGSEVYAKKRKARHEQVAEVTFDIEARK